MTDLVAQLRKSQVDELGALVDACAEERLNPAAEVDNVVGRLRELYFFAPEFRSLVEHINDVATRNNLVDWANHGGDLSSLPWGRIRDAGVALLDEPPLYQRDWSNGPIEPQYARAIGGWVDLGDCARRARAACARGERIDDLELLVGTMTVIKYVAVEGFKVLKSPAVDLLEEIFQAILERPDLDLDMFPASLTYFGSDGLQVLNHLTTQGDDLTSTLLRFADQGLFDAKGTVEPAASPGSAAPTVTEPAHVSPVAGVSLTKGGNVSLTKQAPDLTAVAVGLGWDVRTTAGDDFDLDASAIACGEARRVVSDEYFVFYNNMTSPDGSIVHTGDNRTGEGEGDDEVINVDLASVPAHITNVFFTVSIYDERSLGLTFGQVQGAFIRVVDRSSDVELARYDLSEDASTETAMVFGELYRRGTEWKFRAIGQGYESGLAGIAKEYGINV